MRGHPRFPASCARVLWMLDSTNHVNGWLIGSYDIWRCVHSKHTATSRETICRITPYAGPHGTRGEIDVTVDSHSGRWPLRQPWIPGVTPGYRTTRVAQFGKGDPSASGEVLPPRSKTSPHGQSHEGTIAQHRPSAATRGPGSGLHLYMM